LAVVGYHWDLFGAVPGLLWKGADLVVTAIGVILAVLLFLNRNDIAQHSPFPDWIWTIPVALVVLWGLMDANFKKFDAERNRADSSEGKLSTLNGSLKYMLSVWGIDFGFFLPPGAPGRSIKVGISLRNNSTIPLRFERHRMSVVVGGRTLAHPVYDSDGAVIDASGGLMTYYFPPIPEIPDQLPLVGTIECEFRYGPALGDIEWLLKWSANLELGEVHPLAAPVQATYTTTKQEVLPWRQSSINPAISSQVHT
jgi:hypothetical protein